MKIIEDLLQLIIVHHMIYGIGSFVIAFLMGNYLKRRHDGTLNKFFEGIVLGGLAILKFLIVVAIIIVVAFVFDTEQEREDAIVLVFYYFGVVLTGFTVGAIYQWRKQKEENQTFN